MPTNAIPAVLTKLNIKRGSPPAYSEIKEVISISGPDGEAQEIDASSLSFAGAQTILGVIDEGSITFDVNALPTDVTHQYLETARLARTQEDFKIELPDAETNPTSIQFYARVASGSWNFRFGETIKRTFSARISGTLTVTPHSS